MSDPNISKLEEKIKQIQHKLDEAEATDFIYLTRSVQQLRHDILYLHTSLEASIDKKIIQHIQERINLTVQATQEKANLSYNIRTLLNEIDFSKKLKIIDQQKSILKKVIKKLFAVNDLRVYFAHPISHRAKLVSYQEPKNLLKAYEILNDALDSLKEAGIEDRPLVLYMNGRKSAK